MTCDPISGYRGAVEGSMDFELLLKCDAKFKCIEYLCILYLDHLLNASYLDGYVL